MRLSSLFLLGISIITSIHAFSPLYGLEKRAIKPEDVTASLNKFIGRLRVYVTDTEIHAHDFNLQSKNIQKKLIKYTAKAHKLKVPNVNVTSQLSFAQDRLRVLSTASFHNLNPDRYPDPSNDLAHEVMNLDARLLSLQDAHGDPDPNVECYSEKVAKFRQTVRLFQIEKSTLHNLPALSQSILSELIEKVDKTVAGMEAFVNEQDTLVCSSTI